MPFDPTEDGPFKQAVHLAKDIIAGRRELLIGVRDLVPLLHALSLADEGDFETLLSVEGEIDDLPLGHERNIWPRKMWPEIDHELIRVKKQYRKPILAECNRLLQRLAEIAKEEGL